MNRCGALDDLVGPVVMALADGTEYRAMLREQFSAKHITPDGRLWLAVHGVGIGERPQRRSERYWKGYTPHCGNLIFSDVAEYRRNSLAMRPALPVTPAPLLPLTEYIPKPADPIKNVCFNMHIFQNSAGTGNFLTSDVPRLIDVWHWTNQHYAAPDASSDDPTPTPTPLTDTRIRLQLHRVEFYQQDVLNASINVPDLQAAAVARNPTTLDQVNVYFTNGYYQGASGFASMPDPIDMTADAWIVMLEVLDSNGMVSVQDWARAITLSHEFGHVLDLSHTYFGGGASANCNLADPDYLIDVFGSPSDCPHICSWGGPATLQQPPPQYQPYYAVTNNLMGGYCDNFWISGLQGAMMHRALTVKSIKRYVCAIEREWHTIRRPNGSWQSWFGLVQSQESNDPGSFSDVGCGALVDELHVVGIGPGGELWHTIRYPAGNWETSYALVEDLSGDPGPFSALDCAGVGNGVTVDLQIVGVGPGGTLLHTVRYSNGAWQGGFASVESQELNDPGAFSDVACAGVENELHVVAVGPGGQLAHTTRHTNGMWHQWFGNIELQHSNDPGPFTAVACAGVSNGANEELHVVAVGPGGQLWHTIRYLDGSWQGVFGFVEGQESNDPGEFTDVSCSAVNNQLHVVAVGPAGLLWHTIRFLGGNWQSSFELIENQESNDPGAFGAVSCAGVNNGVDNELQLVGIAPG